VSANNPTKSSPTACPGKTSQLTLTTESKRATAHTQNPATVNRHPGYQKTKPNRHRPYFGQPDPTESDPYLSHFAPTEAPSAPWMGIASTTGDFHSFLSVLPENVFIGSVWIAMGILLVKG
jgi:hypothetical protein